MRAVRVTAAIPASYCVWMEADLSPLLAIPRRMATRLVGMTRGTLATPVSSSVDVGITLATPAASNMTVFRSVDVGVTLAISLTKLMIALAIMTVALATPSGVVVILVISAAGLRVCAPTSPVTAPTSLTLAGMGEMCCKAFC